MMEGQRSSVYFFHSISMATAKTNISVNINFRVNLELNEPEARALEAMIGYGFESFKKVFYEKLGKSYMEPHEPGLKSLFESIREQVNPGLQEIDRTKRELVKLDFSAFKK